MTHEVPTHQQNREVEAAHLDNDLYPAIWRTEVPRMPPPQERIE